MSKLVRWTAPLALGAMSASASAHVTIWPKQSIAAAHEKYIVRVPNEKPVEMVALDVRFPAGLRVTSFEQKPGWMTEPIRDGSGQPVGVRWRGSLPPRQFAEFGLLAVNPAAAGDLVWNAVQTFADGSKAEWTGAAGSKTPAPRVTITPVPR